MKKILTVAFLALFALVLGRFEQGIKFFPFALLFYTPISYYTDKWVYDRRQRKKAKEGGGGRAASR